VKITPRELRELIEAYDKSSWTDIELRTEDVHLVLSSSGEPPHAAAPASVTATVQPSAIAATAPSTPAPSVSAPPVAVSAEQPARPASPAEQGSVRITAPSVGLFWRSPAPGEPPFVEVGDEVKAGDTICIVEVMKLMNHIRAEADGVVRSIEFANGDTVEHGDTLITIEPSS
jgi:acetyl-CoA carboxylase biotin carboxyl carrier protein